MELNRQLQQIGDANQLEYTNVVRKRCIGEGVAVLAVPVDCELPNPFALGVPEG
ncbi:MAG: hypothetical protein KME30_18325 [Iphinoe sp. HA4291-MV1]|nr:hypothetical protein [Iphinoe sp. HA4291-MV1]